MRRVLHSIIISSSIYCKLCFSPAQKRDDFRYANGPSYCISEALMMKVEKYLRYYVHRAASGSSYTPDTTDSKQFATLFY